MTKPIRVWFSVYEDGEYLIEFDDFEAATDEEALALAAEDYPGCDRYSLFRLVA